MQLIGLAAAVVGIWGKLNQKNYVAIADSSSQFIEVFIPIIAVGMFMLIIGVVGIVGAIFASTKFGRIVIGLVSWGGVCMCVHTTCL